MYVHLLSCFPDAKAQIVMAGRSFYVQKSYVFFHSSEVSLINSGTYSVDATQFNGNQILHLLHEMTRHHSLPSLCIPTTN